MRAALALIASAFLLSACTVTGGSPVTRFYSLEPVSLGESGPTTARPLSLGVGPVTLPDILDRPQIVTRSGEHAVELAEFHRWAGDLKADLTRLLALRLGAKLGTDRISLYPWPRQRELDYQLRVDVLRFGGELGGELWLTGNWTLLSGKGNEERLFEGFDLRAAAPSADYAIQVQTLSGLVQALAERIADRITDRERR